MRHARNALIRSHFGIVPQRHLIRTVAVMMLTVPILLIVPSSQGGTAPIGNRLPAAATSSATSRSSLVNHRPVAFGAWAAGYIAYAPPGHHFTSVQAQFALPAVADPVGSHQAPAWVAIWAGIGFHAHHGDQLMQAGVMMKATGGTDWSAAVPWWINEPRHPVEPHILTLSVRPGDKVAVSVRQITTRPQVWRFVMRDLSTGAKASGWCTHCTTRGRTAAWLVEDPSQRGAYTPFSNPGVVRFTSATAMLDDGLAVPLGQTDWHPVLRQAASGDQGPLDAVPSPSGGFTVGRVGARSIRD